MKHKSLNETAYEMIRDKILRGDFELGSRLREDLLAEEISMSRTPVREAVNRLVASGLIVNHVRKGLYLIQPEDREIEEFIDIRCALEKLSVEKCIQNLTEANKAKIVSNLTAFKAALDKGDYEKCNALDADFHATIARIADNGKLIEKLNKLADFFQLVRRAEKKAHPKEKNERTLREHTQIADAILAGDVEAAQKTIASNIDTMRINLRSKE